MGEARFVVDEGVLSLDNVPKEQRRVLLYALTEQLNTLQHLGEDVGILNGWGALVCLNGDDVAMVLAQSRVLDRDQSLRLLTLLSRCPAWDQDNTVVTDPAVFVDGVPHKGYGVARARELTLLRQWTAVVTTQHRFSEGVHSVDDLSQSLAAEVYFVVSDAGVPAFFRMLYELDDVPEGQFFELARLAFPNLVFAETVDFRHFEGSYATLRSVVVHHLGQINDRFAEALVAGHGVSSEVSSRMGIAVSIEGSTRSSERLMARRDVEFRGKRYRCEWHSKIEAHRNRIHFHAGDSKTGGRILIGIFHRHLPT